MKLNVLSIALLSGALVVSGCTTDAYTGESKVANTTWGSVIGATVGAGVGVLSSSKSDRGKGALIGALSGAAVGGSVGAYMDVQESKLRAQLQSTGVSVTRDGDNIILNMPNSITFDTSSTNVKPQGVQALMSVALVLKEYPKTIVNIVGHTDSTGTDAINNPLSLQRADSVANILIQQGISVTRIATYGMGSKQPIASNSTEAGRAENRRVQIILTPIQ